MRESHFLSEIPICAFLVILCGNKAARSKESLGTSCMVVSIMEHVPYVCKTDENDPFSCVPHLVKLLNQPDISS